MFSALPAQTPFFSHVTCSTVWTQVHEPEQGGEQNHTVKKGIASSDSHWTPYLDADGKAIASFSLQKIKLVNCSVGVVSTLWKLENGHLI